VDRSREWAVRSYHEAQLHENNCFITLTYNDEHLPADGSVDVRHWQLFAKRLRKLMGPFRYFHCGEYGGKNQRPHYHACLFGLDFPDKVVFQVKDDNITYTSEVLAERWGMGFCTIGAVTFESAAYCARYILKKYLGEGSEEHYEAYDLETGEVQGHVKPEYVTQSRNHGLAHGWLERFGLSEIYPDDFVVIGNRKLKVPSYYDVQLEKLDPVLYEQVKAKRLERMELMEHEYTPERLAVRKEVFVSRIKKLKRNLEGEE